MHRILAVLLGLAVFFGIFFVWPFAADVHQYPKFLLFSALAGTAGACWLLLQLLRRERAIFFFPGGREALFFIGIVFLSFLFAKEHALAFFGNPDQVGIPALAIGAFVLFLFLVVQCVSSVSAVRRAIMLFLGCAVLAFLFFLGRAFLPLSGFFPRMGLSVFGFNPSVTSFFAVVTAVLACGNLLFSPTEKKWQYLFSWITLAVSIGLVVLIGQQSAGTGLVLGLGMLFLVRFHAGWRGRIAAIVLVFGLFASFFGAPPSFRLALPSETRISTVETWQTAHRALSQDVRSFLFGTGFATFPNAFARFRPVSVNASPNFSVVASPPSGTVFGLLTEGGVLTMLGLLLFVAISGHALMKSLYGAVRALSQKTVRDSAGQEDAMTVLSLGAAVLASVVAAVALPPTFSVVCTIVLLYAGLLTAATVIAGRTTRPFLPSRWLSFAPFRVGAVCVVVVLWFCLIAALAWRGAAEFWYGQGIRAFSAGAILEARDDAEMTARLLPNDRRAQLVIAQATIMLAEKADADSPLREQARSMLSALIDAADQDPSLLLATASAAARLAAGTPDAGPVVRDALLALDRIAPGNPTLQLLLGDALARTDDPKGAVDRYARAVALRPGFVDAYLHWAQLAATIGDAQTAMDLGAQAARIAPSAREPLVFLVNVALARRAPGDEDRAIVALQTLLAQHPDDEQAEIVLAGVLESVHRLPEAQELYQELNRRHPDDPTFPQALSRIEAGIAAERASSTPTIPE